MVNLALGSSGIRFETGTFGPVFMNIRMWILPVLDSGLFGSKSGFQSKRKNQEKLGFVLNGGVTYEAVEIV